MLFGLTLALVLGALLAVPLSRASLIVPGQPSPVTLEAPASISFVSEVKTHEAQVQAENSVAPVYQTDPAVTSQQRKGLVSTLDTVGQIRRNPSLNTQAKLSALTAIGTLPITPTVATALLQFTDDEWQRVVDESRKLYDTTLHARDDTLTEEDVRDVRERVLPYISLTNVTPAQRQIVLYFVGAVLKPNRTVDQARTEQRRQEADATVTPVQVSVVRGENVVRRGDIVSDADFEKLTKLGLVRGAGGWITTLQMLLLGALTAWLFTMYINHAQPSVVANGRGLFVIGSLMAIALLLGRLLIPNWDTTPYVFPLATMSILLTVLFGGELSLIATLAMAPLLGLQHQNMLGVSLPLALGAAAGIFTTQRAHRMSQFAWVALAVSTVTALSAFAFWLTPDGDVSSIALILLVSLLNGALSAILSIGSYHFLGRMAGVVTPLELMELSHPNQPLLRRMIREAPGTYHHSIVVSNLAEVAAEEIGADPLLARVGAYYHDIGKLLRPYFFTDNQHDRSNVHDVLDPKTSAAIIIDHVREGAKLALDNGLPQRIVDFIPQHHGTNLVSFFYQRALQQNEDISIEDFRYPGPKPQTREAAILMMADGVEATVRAKSQAGKLRSARPEEDEDGGRKDGGQTISEIVDQIVNERISSGELDEAPITLRDITVIKQSFIRTLQGIYHPRVDYPQLRAPVAEEPAVAR